MKVSELARQLAVTADTVRFYTRIGFLQPNRNDANGYREYRADDQQRLRFILNARQLGFSVEDIRQILAHADQGQTPCPTVRRLLEQRLAETEQRFLEAQLLRDRMRQALTDWNDKPDHAPTGTMICHLVEEFSQKITTTPA